MEGELTVFWVQTAARHMALRDQGSTEGSSLVAHTQESGREIRVILHRHNKQIYSGTSDNGHSEE